MFASIAREPAVLKAAPPAQSFELNSILSTCSPMSVTAADIVLSTALLALLTGARKTDEHGNVLYAMTVFARI
jgi:hypothetical protein